jgi:hypothetical protein
MSVSAAWAAVCTLPWWRISGLPISVSVGALWTLLGSCNRPHSYAEPSGFKRLHCAGGTHLHPLGVCFVFLCFERTASTGVEASNYMKSGITR